jgi:hypothetical protein
VCGSKHASLEKLQSHMRMLHDREQRKRGMRLAHKQKSAGRKNDENKTKRIQQIESSKDWVQHKKYRSVVDGLVWVDGNRAQEQQQLADVDGKREDLDVGAQAPHAPMALNRRVAAALKSSSVIETIIAPDVDAAIMRAAKAWMAELPLLHKPHEGSMVSSDADGLLAAKDNNNATASNAREISDVNDGRDGGGGSGSGGDGVSAAGGGSGGDGVGDADDVPEDLDGDGAAVRTIATDSARATIAATRLAKKVAARDSPPRGCLVVVSSDNDFAPLLTRASKSGVVAVVFMLGSKKCKLGNSADVVLSNPGVAPQPKAKRKTGAVASGDKSVDDSVGTGSGDVETYALSARARTEFGRRFMAARGMPFKARR